MPRILSVMMFGALLLFLVAGCGPPPVTVTNTGCNVDSGGKLLLLWTFLGQPANASTCVGIASLDLVLSPDACAGSIEIEPIVPCARDGVAWRYDNLPVGPSTVQLAAKSAGGTVVRSGATRVDLTPSLPAVPNSIDLM